MAAELDSKARALLEAPNFAHVATHRADGTIHLVAVWVDVEADHVVLNSAEGREWPRNVRRDPRVTLSVPNLDDPYEYVEIRGRVVEDMHEGADEHIDRLAKKYYGLDRYPSRRPGERRVIFRVAPEWVRHYGG